MTTYFDEYRDISLITRSQLVSRVRILNLNIKLENLNSKLRPSKQSRKEAKSRANYFIKQRDALLNLYPECFL